MSKLRNAVLLASCLLLASCSLVRPTVTLALLGDVMLGRGVDPKPGSLAYLAPELKAADLSLANLESPLAPAETYATPRDGYNLCSSALRAGLLPVWGLDMLSLANNHALDCGADGWKDTAQAVTEAGLTPLGPGPEPVYRELNGLKLAFLAFDDITAPIDLPAALEAVHSARETGAAVVIVVHWGAEYQGAPTDRQEFLAQQFAAAGAVLIVGSHPHVLQPAEWIPTAQGKTLVLYSLGNALFDQGGLPDTRQSALVVVTLDGRGVQSVRAVPFALDVVASRVVAPDATTSEQIRARLNLP